MLSIFKGTSVFKVASLFTLSLTLTSCDGVFDQANLFSSKKNANQAITALPSDIGLIASRSYLPSSFQDAEFELPRDAVIALPSSIPVSVGSAANKTFTLKFDNDLICTYQGGSTYSDPLTNLKLLMKPKDRRAEIDKGKKYTFRDCYKGTVKQTLVAGSPITVKDKIIAHIDGGDALLPTLTSFSVHVNSWSDAPKIFSADVSKTITLTSLSFFLPGKQILSGIYYLPEKSKLTLPPTIATLSGNTAHGYAKLIFDGSVSCIYKGRNDKPHTKLNEAIYSFVKCVDGVSDIDSLLNLPANSFLANQARIFSKNVELQVEKGHPGCEYLAAKVSLPFFKDVTKPVVSSNLQTPLLTNQSSLSFTVNVIETSNPQTTITFNGITIVSNSSTLSIPVTVTLAEGQNTFVISSVDTFGNAITPINYSGITLDTTPPVLSLTQPSGVTATATFSYEISANEAISAAMINANTAGSIINTTSPNGSTITGTAQLIGQGVHSLVVVARDLAGNTTTTSFPVTYVEHLVRPELISFELKSDFSKIIVRGMSGATWPGTNLTLNGGFFNKVTLTSLADGSFTAELDFFNSLSVVAESSELERSESTSLQNNLGQNSLLSGVVKDTENRVLPGIRVRFDSMPGNEVITDSAGVFQFAQPPTGNQLLVIDGAWLSPEVTGPTRKFGTTKLSINIGFGQRNVLDRAIFLAPIYTDGTESEIAPESGGIASSTRAPGVEINIPANTAQFPGNTPEGKISMQEISAEVSTIQSPPFVQAKTMIALEPSGLKFSEPVELTLPNSNGLPAGTDMVILSMNSSKGIWEIGGFAKVSSDGNKVVTKEGKGISHFSLVYAAPMAPVIREIGAADRPGANVFDGALETSISLPSFKSMSQDISPSLSYRSNWAKPTAVISNLFDIPRREQNYTYEKNVEGWVPSGPLLFCDDTRCYHSEYEYYFYNISQQTTLWYQPKQIFAQFFMDHIQTERFNYKGAADGYQIPNRGVMNYAVDLKRNDTQEYLESGIYPYRANLEVELEKVTISTTTVRSTSAVHATQITQNSFKETQVLDELYKQPDLGLLVVQNKRNGVAGRGWNIGGAQRIMNPSNDRVVIEEADGKTSLFALDNTIETLVDGETIQIRKPNSSDFYPKLDLSGGSSFANWPYAYLTSPIQKEQYFIKYNLLDGTLADTTELNGEPLRHMGAMSFIVDHGRLGVTKAIIPAKYYFKPYQIFDSQGSTGEKYRILSDPKGLYRNRGKLFDFWGYRYLGGVVIGGIDEFRNNCFGVADEGCTPIYECDGRAGIGCPGNIYDDWKSIGLGRTSDDYPEVGFESQAYAAQVCNGNDAGCVWQDVTQYNDAKGIAQGPVGIFYLADSGNHNIRIVKFEGNDWKGAPILVGNRSNQDPTEGVLGKDTAFPFPQGITTDRSGNLYVTLKNHGVYKVKMSQDGLTALSVEHIAGSKVDRPGAVFSDHGNALDIILTNPNGLAIDDDQKLLYVADTDNNRIVKIDLVSKELNSVAGTGQAGFNGDGIAALAANLNKPTHLSLDPNKNLLVMDTGNNRVRRINLKNSLVNGVLAYSSTTKDPSSILKNDEGTVTKASLTRLVNKTWVRKYRNGNTSFYDVNGNQTATQDRVGRVTSYQYDGSSRLVRVILPTNQSITYNYSGSNLISIVDTANRTTQFNYTGNLLTRVIFPDSSSRRYEYSADGLMTAEIDQRGNRTEYSYNSWNRLAQVKRPDGNSVTVNDSASGSIANSYTGGVKGELKAFGSGNSDLKEVVKDAKGTETKFVRDFNGYVETVTDSENKTTTIKRDLDGHPISVTRFDGTHIDFTYDSGTGDLLTKSDSSTGLSETKSYDRFGNLVSQSSSTGLSSQNQFDPLTGLLLSKSDSSGNTVSYAYNALGLPTTVTNALGKTASSQYDLNGNVTQVSDALSKTKSYTLNSAGLVQSTTDQNGKVTPYEYDSLNRLTAVISPKNERTEYSYLATGELSQVKDSKENTILFEYDLMGRLTKKTDQNGKILTRVYDVNGNVTGEIDPNGNTKAFEYDLKNRLITKTLPDDLFQFSYDNRGNVSQVKNNKTDIDNSYDDSDRLIQITSLGLGNFSDYGSHALSYTYTASGNRLSMRDEVGTTNYGYDSSERLTNITNPKGESFQFGYDVMSRLNQISRPGSSTSFNYDDRSLLSQIVHTGSSSNVISSFVYGRNNLGNLTSISTNTASKNYAYDFNQQLVSGTNTEAPSTGANASYQSESFGYDSIGNRVSDQNGAFVYDLKSQLLTEDYRYFYHYDNNGNLISKQEKANFPNSAVTNYSYSSENQMISFKVFNSGSSTPAKEVTYTYDALGRRVEKVVVDHEHESDNTKTFTKRFVYDGQEIDLEFDGSNQLLARYTHSGLRTDDVLAVEVTTAGRNAGLAQNSQSYFYHKDHLGSVTDISDSSGNKLQHYIYSAFGMILGIQDANAGDISSNPVLATSYGFTNREHDSESGLMYYRARYYDQNTGRFLQKDPEPGKIAIPVTIQNSYIYTENNAINATDPTGKFAFLIPVVVFLVDLAITAAVSGAVTGIISGLISGAVSSNSGRGFLSGFSSGFASGFVSGAIQGAATFGLGAFGAALGLAQGVTALGAGTIMGIANGVNGYKDGGLAGGLLGFTGGFVGGTLGAYGGIQAFSTAGKGFSSIPAFTSSLFKEIISPQIPNFTEFLDGAGIGGASSAGCSAINTLCTNKGTK